MELIEKIAAFIGRKTTPMRVFLSFMIANLVCLGIAVYYQIDNDAVLLAIVLIFFAVFVVVSSKRNKDDETASP